MGVGLPDHPDAGGGSEAGLQVGGVGQRAQECRLIVASAGKPRFGLFVKVLDARGETAFQQKGLVFGGA